MRYRIAMQLSSDTQRGTGRIIAYTPGSLSLAERTLRSSVILHPDGVLDWPVSSAEDITPASLSAAFELRPEVILLATGRVQVWPPAEVYARALERRIGLEVMEIGAACRTYNLLAADQRRVVLAAILG
jgi:uncharacterized protein